MIEWVKPDEQGASLDDPLDRLVDKSERCSFRDKDVHIVCQQRV